MANKKNEVTVTAEKFDLQTLTGDFAEAIAEEMNGLGSIPFDRIKIPSGGGLAFEVPGEDEDSPDMVKELVGVILHHHPINAHWEEKFQGGNEAPDCSSIDGKIGIVRETGEIKKCADCPCNKFASDGSGKACKNIHRVYFLREGNPVPLIISLPPTSLKFMRDYIGKRILLKGLRSYDAITKITLKKEKSSGGIDYSRAVFTFVNKLTDEQREATKAMAESLKNDSSIAVDDSDYNTAPEAGDAGDGFINVPPDNNIDNIPFN